MSRPRRPPARPETPHASGRAGELLAARHLLGQGWRVVAHNLRTRQAEIDLLVRRGRSYAAVEVKARRDHPAPERLVGSHRLDRLERALLALAPSLRPPPRELTIAVAAIRWMNDGETEVRYFPAVRKVLDPGVSRRRSGDGRFS